MALVGSTSIMRNQGPPRLLHRIWATECRPMGEMFSVNQRQEFPYSVETDPGFSAELTYRAGVSSGLKT